MKSARKYVYAVIICGLGGLLLSGSAPVPVVVSALVLVAGSYVLRGMPARAARVVGALLFTVFGLGGVGVFAVSAMHRDPAGGMLMFTICESLALLFAPETSSVGYLSCLLALLQMVCAGAGAESLGFGIALLFFTISLSLALVALGLQEDESRFVALLGQRGGGANPPPLLVDPVITWLGLTDIIFGVIAIIVLTTVFLFFVIPRYGGGYLLGSGDKGSRVGAFSDMVNLGATGSLEHSENIVMRVELLGDTTELPMSLRWRGAGLDHFDGKKWTASPGEIRHLAGPKRGYLEAEYTVDRTCRPTQRLLRQRVYLEGDTSTVFAVGQVKSVRARLAKLDANREGTISIEFPEYRAHRYVVTSDTARPSPAALRHQKRPMPAWAMERYLQLPSDLDAKVGELARTIVGTAPTTYDRVAKLEEYLATRYSYYLEENVEAASNHPLEDFLLRSKRGHCEHFAAGLVVLLRTLGIPSRLVNGYMQGSYSSVGSYYIIRDSNAHSWAEVYFPDAGWLEFDGTPEAPAPITSRFALPAWMGLYLDAITMAWRRHVIEYEALDQAEYLRAILQYFSWLRISPKKSGPPRPFSAPKGLPPVVIFVLLVGFVLAAFFVGLQRRAQDSTPVAPALGDAEFYLTLLSSLAKRGVVKERDQTPEEFCARCTTAYPSLSKELHAITEAYYLVRFGGALLTTEERARIRGWLERVQGEVKKSAPATCYT